MALTSAAKTRLILHICTLRRRRRVIEVSVHDRARLEHSKYISIYSARGTVRGNLYVHDGVQKFCSPDTVQYIVLLILLFLFKNTHIRASSTWWRRRAPLIRYFAHMLAIFPPHPIAPYKSLYARRLTSVCKEISKINRTAMHTSS